MSSKKRGGGSQPGEKVGNKKTTGKNKKIS